MPALHHPQEAPAARRFGQRFSSTRRGARLARLLAAQQLTDWGIPRGTRLHDRVTLVVAELAANAALHGRVPGRDFALLLVCDAVRRTVRVEVTDTHPALPARLPLAADADADGGRGLVLVDATADRWGVRERCGPGKTVWAECAHG